MDFNFFESIKKEKNKKKSGAGLSLGKIAFIGIAVLAGLTGWNLFEIDGLKKETAGLQQEVEINQNKDVETEFKFLSEELGHVRESKIKINRFVIHSETKDTANSSLLKIIQSSIPQNLFLSNFEVRDGAVAISGVAINKKLIADYEKLLNNSNILKDVFIANSDEDSSFDQVKDILGYVPYKFNISAKLIPDSDFINLIKNELAELEV